MKIGASFDYIPALDGFRAVSILLVMLSHFGLSRIVPGGFGVTVFFFISGFLITRLMFAESNATGAISLKAFYIRRFRRLAPALLTLIAVATISFVLLNKHFRIHELFAALFYYMNYYALAGADQSLPIGALWSLAVEEQYYIVFPVFFLLMLPFPKRSFTSLLFAISAAVLCWRLLYVLALHGSSAHVYYATDCRIDSILIGAAFASMLESDPWIVGFIERRRVITWISVAALFTSFVYRNVIFRDTIRFTLQGLALIPIFVSILLSHRWAVVRNVLSSKLLTWIGKVSYSLYLWHEFAFFVVTGGLLVGSSTITLTQGSYAMALSFVFATISYYVVEQTFRFKRAKKRDPLPAT